MGIHVSIDILSSSGAQNCPLVDPEYRNKYVRSQLMSIWNRGSEKNSQQQKDFFSRWPNMQIIKNCGMVRHKKRFMILVEFSWQHAVASAWLRWRDRTIWPFYDFHDIILWSFNNFIFLKKNSNNFQVLNYITSSNSKLLPNSKLATRNSCSSNLHRYCQETNSSRFVPVSPTLHYCRHTFRQWDFPKLSLLQDSSCLTNWWTQFAPTKKERKEKEDQKDDRSNHKVPNWNYP